MNKNEEIARMIDWKNKKHSLGYFYWEKSDGTMLPAFKLLLFDKDANWQFEAMDWLEKKGFQSYIVFYPHTKLHVVDIWNNDLEVPECIINYSNYNKKEAIFEALFQFSQHLKK